MQIWSQNGQTVVVSLAVWGHHTGLCVSEEREPTWCSCLLYSSLQGVGFPGVFYEFFWSHSVLSVLNDQRATVGSEHLTHAHTHTHWYKRVRLCVWQPHSTPPLYLFVRASGLWQCITIDPVCSPIIGLRIIYVYDNIKKSGHMRKPCVAKLHIESVYGLL